MGWKWNDIAAGVDELVQAKKAELAGKLAQLADIEDSLAKSVSSGQDSSYHKGRAAAFREVHDAVKPR